MNRKAGSCQRDDKLARDAQISPGLMRVESVVIVLLCVVVTIEVGMIAKWYLKVGCEITEEFWVSDPCKDR